MYRFFIRPLLFLLPPETIHHLVFKILKGSYFIPFVPLCLEWYCKIKSKKPSELHGIRLLNPVGLAAGFDKNALLISEIEKLGFGFMEIGTVTPLPQSGNPKPRMFRLPKDSALLNRMGFNNDGVEVIAERLRKRKSRIIIGANIGKNKNTPNENAADDYVICFEKLFGLVDYFTVNVSSPNTPGLRALQDKEPLTVLLGKLSLINKSKPDPKPILLKIAPDLNEQQLDDIVEIVQKSGIAGVVATNTTISRERLNTSAAELDSYGPGGISGRPVRERSTEVIRYLHKRSNGGFLIIGSGGIHSPEDAMEKIKAGSSLVQLYTGFIYEGPSLVPSINKYLNRQS